MKKYIPIIVIALVALAAGCVGTNTPTTTQTTTTTTNPIQTITNPTTTTTQAITTTSANYMPITGPGTYTWKTEIISPPQANTSTFIHVKYNWIVSIVHVTNSTFTYNNTTTTTGMWYWYIDRIIGSHDNTITFVGWIPWDVNQTNFILSTYTGTYINGTLKAGYFTLIGIGPASD